MNHAGAADEYDPLQLAAYAIIEQATPFFDFSDDDVSDAGTINVPCSVMALKEHRERPLNPIQHNRVPYAVVDIFPEGGGELSPDVARPAASQLATLADFAHEFASRPTHQQAIQQGRRVTRVAHAPVMDDMFSRISAANSQRPHTNKGRRRQLPLALPSLHSTTQAKYQVKSPPTKTSSLASRR